MRSISWTMCVTLPVNDWLKPRVSHCIGIITQTVVQNNYHNCYYVAITSVLFWCRGWCVWCLLCTWDQYEAIHYCRCIFRTQATRWTPNQEHISKKKQQEVSHKFLLHMHGAKPTCDCSTVVMEHARVIMTVYPHVIGLTLLWSSRLLMREPAQL